VTEDRARPLAAFALVSLLCAIILGVNLARGHVPVTVANEAAHTSAADSAVVFGDTLSPRPQAASGLSAALAGVGPLSKAVARTTTPASRVAHASSHRSAKAKHTAKHASKASSKHRSTKGSKSSGNAGGKSSSGPAVRSNAATGTSSGSRSHGWSKHGGFPGKGWGHRGSFTGRGHSWGHSWGHSRSHGKSRGHHGWGHSRGHGWGHRHH